MARALSTAPIVLLNNQLRKSPFIGALLIFSHALAARAFARVACTAGPRSPWWCCRPCAAASVRRYCTTSARGTALQALEAAAQRHDDLGDERVDGLDDELPGCPFGPRTRSIKNNPTRHPKPGPGSP